MIGRLKGIVAEVAGDTLIVDVGGVGYLVQVPHRLAERTVAGDAIVLLIETVVREDAIRLYGFETRGEKAWFQKLQDVQGVGAKVALSLIGTLTIDALGAAIALQDAAVLARAPGVGQKLAKRIAAELKDRAGGPASADPLLATSLPIGALPPLRADAISALVNLGYAPLQATGAIDAAMARLGAGAGLDALIKEGLKALV